MLVQAISSIDDWNIDVLRHHERSAGVRMADDDDICTDGAQRVPSIEQGFAFLDAGTARLNQDRVRTHCFGGDLEAAAGAGGGLVEKQDDTLALEQRPRLVRIHPPGKLQDLQHFTRIEMFYPEQRT